MKTKTFKTFLQNFVSGKLAFWNLMGIFWAPSTDCVPASFRIPNSLAGKSRARDGMTRNSYAVWISSGIYANLHSQKSSSWVFLLGGWCKIISNSWDDISKKSLAVCIVLIFLRRASLAASHKDESLFSSTEGSITTGDISGVLFSAPINLEEIVMPILFAQKMD